MSDTNNPSSIANTFIRIDSGCTIGSIVREFASAREKKPTIDVMQNLVKILGKQTIAEPESSEEEYDADESDFDDDEPTLELTNTASSEESTDFEESPSVGESSDFDECCSVDEEAMSSENDCISVVDTSAEVTHSINDIESSNVQDTTSDTENVYHYPNYATTPLRSQGGLTLPENIALSILNILKADRQNKALTNFQQASQYCYALAQPIIWTELVVTGPSYRSVLLNEGRVRSKWRNHPTELGGPSAFVPTDSERRVWMNHLTRQKTVVVVNEGNGLVPERAFVRYTGSAGIWAPK